MERWIDGQLTRKVRPFELSLFDRIDFERSGSEALTARTTLKSEMVDLMLLAVRTALKPG